MLDKQPLPVSDLQLPDPVGWWPPAPGWWLLLIMAMLAIAGAMQYRRKWRRQPGQRKLRSAALGELDAYYQRYQLSRAQAPAGAGDEPGPETAQFIQQVSALLKRVALLGHEPQLVAGLSGEPWADFLTRGQDERCRAQIRALLTQGYRPLPKDCDIDPLYQFARRWIASKEVLPG